MLHRIRFLCCTEVPEMSLNDYSGIHEIEFSTVGERETISSLEGFIRDGFRKFHRHYMRHNPGSDKRVLTYPGSDHTTYLGLWLYPDRKRPNLFGFSMGSSTDDISTIFQLANGYVDIEFDGFDISQNEQLRRKVDIVRQGSSAQVDNVGLYFDSPQKSYVVKRAEVQKRKIHWTGTVSADQVRLADVEMTDQLKLILESADRITIKDEFYANDERGNIIRDSWSITRQKPGTFVWNYWMRAGHNQSLPFTTFFYFESFFDLIKEKFEPKSLRKARFSKPGLDFTQVNTQLGGR